MKGSLLNDETLRESIKYRPKLLFGVKNPLEEHEYLLTDERVIKETEGLFGEGVRDLPLNEIVSVNYEKGSKKLLVISAILNLLGTLLLAVGGTSQTEFTPATGAALGATFLAFGLIVYYTAKTKSYVPLLIYLSGNVVAYAILSSPIPVGGILLLLYALYFEKSEFVIQSSNPKASIRFPSSRSDRRSRNFAQAIRQAIQDDKRTAD